ncbi:HAD family hydrolase [Pedobacter faecalis]|uniref:HAD family hydrolase n=1 Tax=Pedobacter faecalis TaxID=3041495 RepID=UPI00254FC7C2|nr:HAD family phosphatase [Pedobacter sp. ELA7]
METDLAQKIKNIIFDYGNVIFEIDFLRTQNAFSKLGISNVEEFFAHKGHNQIFNDLETAAISPAQFRDAIRTATGNQQLTDGQINDAWNSLLIGVPSKHVHDTLLRAKERYRTFLLSNTNEIHYNWITDHLKNKYEMTGNESLFERVYYSQQMFLRKPDIAIFDRVLQENGLKPEETLFIDDSPQHLEGARKAGLRTLLMDRHPSQLHTFLSDHGLL